MTAVAIGMAIPAAWADQTTLEITSDVAAIVYLDGLEVARVAAEATVEVAVSTDEHEVWVVAEEAPGVGEMHLVEVWAGRSEEIDVELEREVEDWLSSDPDRRDRAPWDSHLELGEDGVLNDPERGLEWAWTGNGRDVDWDAAVAYCQSLRLAGHGWRLPTVDELETLVSSSSRRGLRLVEPIWMTACCAWSSETHGSVSAWYLGFDAGLRGFVTRDYAEGGRALCVRGQGSE